jgi:hypothetical protein
MEQHLFIVLSNDAFRTAQRRIPGLTVNREFRGMREEAVVSYFKLLLSHLLRGTEGNKSRDNPVGTVARLRVG